MGDEGLSGRRLQGDFGACEDRRLKGAVRGDGGVGGAGGVRRGVGVKLGKELQAGAVRGVCVEAAEGREGGFELLEGVGVGERAQTEVGEGGKVAEVAAGVVGVAEEELEGWELK